MSMESALVHSGLSRPSSGSFAKALTFSFGEWLQAPIGLRDRCAVTEQCAYALGAVAAQQRLLRGGLHIVFPQRLPPRPAPVLRGEALQAGAVRDRLGDRRAGESIEPVVLALGLSCIMQHMQMLGGNGRAAGLH